MKERWSILNSGPGEPAWNMALDEALLEFASTVATPILRLYSWSTPAATFGYFQKYGEIAGWTGLRPLIRRPTGGGLVPHDGDWTYTLVLPPASAWYSLRAEESYQRAHEWLRLAFASLRQSTSLAPCCLPEAPGRCFAGAEKFDLLSEGRKIAGAAQRRNKSGLLIQGSVQNQPAGSARPAWEEAMAASAAAQWGIEWQELKLSPALLDRAGELCAGKYSQPGYNQRR